MLSEVNKTRELYRQQLTELLQWTQSELVKFGERVEAPKVAAPKPDVAERVRAIMSPNMADTKAAILAVMTTEFQYHRDSGGIAAKAGIDAPTALAALKQLVAAGTVERRPNAARPLFKLSSTPTG